MIAQETDDVPRPRGLEGHQGLDHRGTVGTAVDVVAEADDRVGPSRGMPFDLGKQAHQQVVPAVDVANRVGRPGHGP